MKYIFILYFVLNHFIIQSKTYIDSSLFDYKNTNKKCFVINNTPNDEANDFLSAMRLSKAIGEVSAAPIGNNQNIKSFNGNFNFKISRVKFTKPNLSSLLDNFMDELKLIIIEPQNGIQNNKPCVLVTCGGGNMNESHRAFYLGLAEYAMKGYVVAYYENPNATIRLKDQFIYLLSELPEKNCFPNNCPPETVRKFYDMSLYLGVQTTQAVVNFMAANKSIYNIDSNNFFASGQSYGGFCTVALGLGSKKNYYNESGTLNVPFNLLGIPNKYAISRNDYTIKAISPWSGNYPTVDNINTHTNPFGEFIDNIQSHQEKNGDYLDKPDARVIHFHGQNDIEINVYEGWLNGTVDSSLYSHGPYNVVQRFKKANVPFFSFINCKGGHGVIDFLNLNQDSINVLEDKLTNYIDTINYLSIDINKIINDNMLKELSYSFGQIMDIIDHSAYFYQNDFSYKSAINPLQTSYKSKSIIKGHYLYYENCEIPLSSFGFFENEKTIKIYPNPVSTNLRIENLTIKNPLQIEIYNSIGIKQYETIINISDEKNEINIENFNEGIYYVRITNDRQLLLNQKIIILK